MTFTQSSSKNQVPIKNLLIRTDSDKAFKKHLAHFSLTIK
jgi:hypothetical protein